MANSYNLYRYHELKKRLEDIEKRLDSDWYIPECVFYTLEKEKEDIYEELIKNGKRKVSMRDLIIILICSLFPIAVALLLLYFGVD